VVVLIATLAVTTAFTLYRVTAGHYVKEDARLEQNQNLRVALQTLARDVRMAGNGLALLGPQVQLIQAYVPGLEKLSSSGAAERKTTPGWFAHADISPAAASGETGIRAIFGVDGGADHPDTLTIFRAEVESGHPIGRLAADYEPGPTSAGRLLLKEPYPDEILRDHDIIALVNGTEAVILEIGDLPAAPAANLPINLGGRFTSPLGPPRVFPQGSHVYNLRDATLATYYVDQPKNNLMVDYHDVTLADPDDPSLKGPVTVASDIEDLQVFYYYDQEEVDPSRVGGTPDLSSAALKSGRRVRAVALALTARSARGDGQGARYRSPTLFNHAAGGSADDHPRTILTETIFLRNFQ
jgi:hypothetical protein